MIFQLHCRPCAVWLTVYMDRTGRNIVNLDGVPLDCRRVRQWACGARPIPCLAAVRDKNSGHKRMQEIEQINKDLLAL